MQIHKYLHAKRFTAFVVWHGGIISAKVSIQTLGTCLSEVHSNSLSFLKYNGVGSGGLPQTVNHAGKCEMFWHPLSGFKHVRLHQPGKSGQVKSIFIAIHPSVQYCKPKHINSCPAVRSGGQQSETARIFYSKWESVNA